MAAVQSGARKSANRWDMPDPIYWVWKKLTSVKVAVSLIALVAVAAFVSVVIPQVPPQFTNSSARIDEHVELQRGTWGFFTDILADFPWFYDAQGGIFNLFNQPYWFALVVVMALAVTTCTISRFPPIWRTVRRPQRRVNDAYFERAKNRFDLTLPDAAASGAASGDAAASGAASGDASGADLVERAFRRKQYSIRREERDGAVYLFADRFSWAQLGTFLSHAGLVALILGAVMTKVSAEEFQFWLGEGESRPLFATGDDRAQIQVIVDDASARFADDGQALDFRSAVRVTSRGDEIAAGDVTVNGPLTFDGWRLHQAAYYENGAALQVRDVRDGLVVYSETLMLEDQVFGPRVTIASAGSGEIISEEVVPPAFEIADHENSGYQLVPLAPGVSLALILVTSAEGEVQFHYAVVSVGADDAEAGGLDAAALHIDEAPPIAPLVRLYELGSSEPFAETLVPLTERADLPDARIGAIPLDEATTLSVGFREREGERQFFYFLGGESPINGLLAPGERVVVGDVELEYLSQGIDRSQWGRLIEGETQRIGSVNLTYQGAESVFFRTEPRVPGAEGDALILVERFGEGRTTSTFEARGGESVDLVYSAEQDGSAESAEIARAPRLGLGLGGATPRVDIELGESIVIENFEYTFLGPREFTGLTVRKDPGAWVFWGAIVAGLSGLLITFFVPRRRIWAKITPERTYLAGLAGHGVNLRRDMGHLARAVGSPDAPPEEDEDE